MRKGMFYYVALRYVTLYCIFYIYFIILHYITNYITLLCKIFIEKIIITQLVKQ
jgi:hypothetical protein